LVKAVTDDKIISIILKAAEDKQATNPIVLNLRDKNSVFDYLVVMSGESNPQLKAIIESIEYKVKQAGRKGKVFEGSLDSGWLVLDLSNIVVHVMSDEERAFYNIEGLWQKDAVITYN